MSTSQQDFMTSTSYKNKLTESSVFYYQSQKYHWIIRKQKLRDTYKISMFWWDKTWMLPLWKRYLSPKKSHDSAWDYPRKDADITIESTAVTSVLSHCVCGAHEDSGEVRDLWPVMSIKGEGFVTVELTFNAQPNAVSAEAVMTLVSCTNSSFDMWAYFIPT